MEKKYSREEHDRCKKVAEVFQELYDMLGDTCVLDAGKFGFIYLTYYKSRNPALMETKCIVMQKNCLKYCGKSGYTVRSCSLCMGQRKRNLVLKRSIAGFQITEDRNMLQESSNLWIWQD